MSLDPSQLSLPQIAAAVVAGELRLIDAEAELRRRPVADPPSWRRAAPPPRPSRQTLAAEVLHALDDTRRELRKATRQLQRLAQRFDELTVLADSLQPAPTPRATAAGPAARLRVPPAAIAAPRRELLDAPALPYHDDSDDSDDRDDHDLTEAGAPGTDHGNLPSHPARPPRRIVAA